MGGRLYLRLWFTLHGEVEEVMAPLERDRHEDAAKAGYSESNFSTADRRFVVLSCRGNNMQIAFFLWRIDLDEDER